MNTDSNSSVSRVNSDICTCKFKLIAFLGYYSMYCVRSDPLRACVRVWLPRLVNKYVNGKFNKFVRVYRDCIKRTKDKTRMYSIPHYAIGARCI